MRKTFEIFVNDKATFDMCNFINRLSARKKKFTVIPWSSADKSEVGFVVWYNKY